MDMKTVPYECMARDLRLGDRVVASMLPSSPFSCSVVCNITDAGATLFRPYATTANFVYTGGVIPYIGIEQYTISPDTTVTVLQETDIPDVCNTETDLGRLERSGVAERRRREALRRAV